MGTNLEKFLKDIEHLQEAHEILEKIWLELDPYRARADQISDATWNKVRNYFKFDDSE